jgi:hypothetical protein
MSGYAPNPKSPDEEVSATISTRFLARKGEALPSVDSHAHEGIDIDMRPVKPAGSPGAPPDISEGTIGKLYTGGDGKKKKSNVEPFPRQVKQLPPPANMQAGPAPQKMTILPPKKPATMFENKPSGQSARPMPHKRPAPRATVKFRLTLQDFIRLRFAARDLETNCQELMLEALECYFEANDIAPVSKEDMAREIQRLKSRMKSRSAPKMQS